MRTFQLHSNSMIRSANLPAVADDFIFQAGGLLTRQGETWKIQWLEFSAGNRLYQSMHSSIVQQLELGLEDGTSLLLEMELITGWSGQGGCPDGPWQGLLGIARRVNRSCGVPLRVLSSWAQHCPGGPEGVG